MPDDHESLVEQAAQGEQVAVESLLVRHLPKVRAFLRLRCGPTIRARESVSDLAQSVCREVLEGMAGFVYRGEQPFLGWLFAKALSKIQDRERYYRRKKRDHTREVAAGPADADNGAGQLAEHYASIVTPSRIARGREEIARVEAVFDELPEEYRDVITMRKIAELSYAEIGAQIGKSDAAARALVNRAMRRLGWILSRSAPRDE